MIVLKDNIKQNWPLIPKDIQRHILDNVTPTLLHLRTPLLLKNFVETLHQLINSLLKEDLLLVAQISNNLLLILMQTQWDSEQFERLLLLYATIMRSRQVLLSSQCALFEQTDQKLFFLFEEHIKK